MGEKKEECDCRGMTEGVFLQSIFQGTAGVLHERKPLLGESPGGDFAGKCGDVDRLILPR